MREQMWNNEKELNDLPWDVVMYFKSLVLKISSQVTIFEKYI